MIQNIGYVLFFLAFVMAPPVEARQSNLAVTIKLVSCSQMSGGVYREGPADPPVCGPTSGKFWILSGCKNKFETKSCSRVQKWTSKIGTVKTKLPPGKHHFVWEWEAMGRIPVPSGSCTLDIDSGYDIEINKPGQEVRLTMREHCSAP